MHSFYVLFSKLKHTAPCKAENQNIVKTNTCAYAHACARTHTHAHTHSVSLSLSLSLVSVGWFEEMRVQTMQRKKNTSDQASVCTLREDKKWKYQKKSVADRLVWKLLRSFN